MLDDLTILVVEDDAVLALDIALTLGDDGAAIAGPCASLATAMARADRPGAFDAAVLDVDLRDETVFPLADRLVASATPFVFHTGHHDLRALRARYAGVPIVAKPADPAVLVFELARACGRLPTSARAA